MSDRLLLYTGLGPSMGAFGRPSKFKHEPIRARQPKAIPSEGVTENDWFILRFSQDEGAVLEEIRSQVANAFVVNPHESPKLVKEEGDGSLLVLG